MTPTTKLAIALGFMMAGCAEGVADPAGAPEPIGSTGPNGAFAGAGTAMTPLPTTGLADPETSPYSELYENGLTLYSHTALVTPTEVKEPLTFPNISVYKFGTTGRGPLCMRGGDYFVETRDGSSEDLLVFLEGGGVCLDELCAATVSPFLSLRLLSAGDVIGFGGILDKSDSRNPFSDYDVVHSPYCDGSIYAGDVDRELSDGKWINGTHDPAYQRGLQNLTATFEVAKRRYPTPRRVVLAGTSGGGYGVLVGVAMARYYYPNVPLLVVADSGAPILTSEDPDFIQRIMREINADHLLPASCTNCFANGNATDIVEWAMARDPGLTLAYMGHAQDHVIGEFFMGSTAEQFQATVLRETGRLASRYPSRVARFIIPGDHHMFLIDGHQIPDGVQHTVLGAFGTAVFTGDAVTAAEMRTWTIGGLTETGRNAFGVSVSGYDWLRQAERNLALTPDIVDPGP